MRLDPTNIHQLAADRMSQQEGFVALAETSYIPQHISSYVPTGCVLIERLMHQHEDNVQAVLDNVSAARGALTTLSGKLGSLHDLYRETDEDEAVRLGSLMVNLGDDATYQDGPPLGREGSPAQFPNDEAQLRPPVPMEAIPPAAMFLFKLGGDLLSPSFYILGIIKLATGEDPLEWLTREVIGDYRTVSEVGDAVRAVGELYEQLTEQLTSDAGILFDRWQGAAADSATAYYREFIDQFAQQKGPYDDLARQYEDFAWACFFGAQALYDAVTMFVDYAIQTALELIAGAAGLSTGPGDLAIVAIFEAWKTVTGLHGLVFASCFGIIAVMATAAGALSSVSLASFEEA